jgi:hypothetical protein
MAKSKTTTESAAQQTGAGKLHSTVAGALPQQLQDAIRQLRTAGFTPFSIVMLALQYGPILVQIVQDLITAFTSVEAKATAAMVALPKKAHDGECDPVLAGHLCDTQCALIHALIANHDACHAAGCCLDDDDEPVPQPVASEKK